MADHESSKLDKANHLLLEQPLLRLPFELLRKNLQSARFTVEKEREAVKNSLKETTTAALNGRVQPDDVLQNLDAMIARMRGIKRKMSACADDEARIHRQVNARTAHLSVLAGMHTLDDVSYEHWSRQRLDRLIVDYMLRQGYNDSARRLAEEKKIEDLVDVETFVAMSKIQESLRAGSVTEGLAWCVENKKELRKMEKGKLEFILRYQQYLDLVRTQQQPKLLEAIIHAKKYLVPFRDTYPDEVNRAAGLLAFSPKDSPQTYADLWSPKRWDELARLFTQTHNQLLALPTFPLLHTALSSGLSALKTPACHAAAHQHDASGSATGSVAATASLSSSVCPICSTELNALARNVPYAHHSKSHVDHDLLLLPNGRVYGKAALEEHAVKAGLVPGQIKDLRTGDVYPSDTLKKVFIT